MRDISYTNLVSLWILHFFIKEFVFFFLFCISYIHQHFLVLFLINVLAYISMSILFRVQFRVSLSAINYDFCLN